MRIAIDYTAAINQTAGVGRFVRDLVASMLALDTANQYVLVHASPNPGRQLNLPATSNVSTRGLWFNERFLTALWHRAQVPLPIDLFTGPVDIFHSPDFVLPPVRSGTRILTVHDLAFLIRPECAHERLRSFLEQAVPRSVARADYVIADSENTRNDVVCLMDVDPERVFVVPGGVNPQFVPQSEAEIGRIRAQYELEGPYILGLGMIEPRKNFPLLIEAYARFRSRTGASHQLAIAGGRGWLYEETYRRAEHSAYREDIRFLGYVPDEDLPALYSGAEMFAYPSLYEGFGLPVLEAMACGTPVVCSSTSSLPEFAEGAAVLVSPEDPDLIAVGLEALCTDAALRQDLRGKGLERASGYHWSSAAQRMLDVYARVGTESA